MESYSLNVIMGGIYNSFRSGSSTFLLWQRYSANLDQEHRASWKDMGKFELDDQWHHFRVRFDIKTKLQEYFVDDLQTPSGTDDENELGAGADTLILRNYGLCRHAQDIWIDNLKLYSTE